MSYIPPSRVPPGPPIVDPPTVVPPARIPPGTPPPAGGPPPSPYPGYPPPAALPPGRGGPPPGYIAPTYAYGDQHWAGGFGFDAAMRLARGQDIRHMATPGYTPPPPGITPLPTPLGPRIGPILPGTPGPTPGGARGLPAGAIGDFGTLPSAPAPVPVRTGAAPPAAPVDSRTGVPSPVAAGALGAGSPHPTVANTNGEARQAAYEAQQSAVPIPAQAVVPARATPAIAPPVSVPLQQRPAPTVPTLPNAAPLAVPSPNPPVGV